MTTLHLELPEDLARGVGHTAAELEQLALEALLVRLYSDGRVSSGKAAKALGIPRVAFLDLLGRSGVSIFDDAMDIGAELELAKAVSDRTK